MVKNMDLANHLRNEVNKNIYADLELTWAEYEYVRQTIISKVYNIFKENEDSLISIDIIDASVIITAQSVSIKTLKCLCDLLGFEGKIEAKGLKKSAATKIIFEKPINLDIEIDVNIDL